MVYDPSTGLVPKTLDTRQRPPGVQTTDQAILAPDKPTAVAGAPVGDGEDMAIMVPAPSSGLVDGYITLKLSAGSKVVQSGTLTRQRSDMASTRPRIPDHTTLAGSNHLQRSTGCEPILAAVASEEEISGVSDPDSAKIEG